MAAPQQATPPQSLPANFDAWDKTAAPPVTLPKDFAQWDTQPMQAARSDYWGTKPDEVESFLKSNPNYQYLDADPKFPNRKPGIYPAGPGSEWRTNPNSGNHDIDQWPVDLHEGKNDWEGFKIGMAGATAPLTMELSLPELIGGLVGGAAGDAGGRKIAKVAGGGEVAQEVSGTAGGLLGGGLGAKLMGVASSGARTLYEALPDELQTALRKKAIGMASPRLKNAIDFWDTLGKLRDRATPEPPSGAAELDATGENKDFAGESPPKPARWDAHDATSENKPFAGGMDERAIPQPVRPAYSPGAAGSMVDSVVAPVAKPVAIPEPLAATSAGNAIPRAQAPGSAGSMVRTVAEPQPGTTAPAAATPVDKWANDPLMKQLRQAAAKIKVQEAIDAAKPKESSSPNLEDDLTPLLLESLKQLKAKRAVQ